MEHGLRDELAALLNRHNAENRSNTPDFILAQFMVSCLDAYDEAVKARAEWYGRIDFPGQNATRGRRAGDPHDPLVTVDPAMEAMDNLW